MTAQPIAFYFDFSSPYGYLAAERIDALAERHGRAVAWRPFLLGAVFKTTRTEPLLGIPLKGDYARRDIERSARGLGLPFRLPETFPFLSVAACRAFYWLLDEEPERAHALALALYRRAFAEGGDISRAQTVIEVAEALGVSRAALEAALQDPAVKERLRSEVQAAIAAGVFGSPFMVVDGEPFWGHDRLADVERWLESGGW
ncbi:MAG: 2-hydroxychromene-2-carboxylate isomerase [Tistlia sp.]|uniref:2-hydroxychromene-2-carboxylate isomerase n=1 Tax=Tistlia sp. TaxID=3057121 RepID=UPI0034A5563D